MPSLCEVMASSSYKPDSVGDQNHEIAYVTARDGLLRRLAPNGTPIGKFLYGTQLKIVERTGIKLEVIDNGKKISGEWVGVDFWSHSDGDYSDIVVYVFDGYLGNKSELKVIPDLVMPVVASYNTSGFSYNGINLAEISIDSVFTFEEIDEIQFTKLKERVKDFVVMDSSNSKRDGDTLRIYTEKKIVELIDERPDIDESRINHNFLGQVPFLNASLIEKGLWERREFNLIDNESGELLQVLNLDGDYSEYNCYYPIFSPDKKYMLSIHGSLLEGTYTWMYLYRIGSTSEISLVASANFINWIEAETYWISNNELIIACEVEIADRYGYDIEYRTIIPNVYRYFIMTIK